MTEFLYTLVNLVTRIHNYIMTWNDSCETVLSDKYLHFIVMGVAGMAILLIIYPLFQILSQNHVLIIAWMYVFTVMVVVTFAIEIGQGITGTGVMDMEDIIWVLVGFMFLFIIFAVIKVVICGIIDIVKGVVNGEDED